ncbi:MAG: AMP-binding protein [Gemmataceae bacterium]|nr:AMP-binding protein [Gemmataceae bacterium]
MSGVWVPLGYPAPGSEVVLVDEAGQEVGADEVGEIVVRSPYLALEYWRDPELTRRTFRPDAGQEGGRAYHMGDLGLLRPDGCVEYRGRKDFQVKVRGQRVAVAEVESALLDIDGVKQAVVAGREDGTGDRRLVAYVVPASSGAPSVATLRKTLREQLPGYMVPSAFVLLDALPMTATNKVDRQALPAPETARPALANPYVPPEDPLEQMLTEAWEACLNVKPVGIRDNFFELGGDSLLAVDMLAGVERLLGRKVSPDALLGSASVQRLAGTVLRDAGRGPRSRLVGIQEGRPQRRLFFLHGDYTGGGLYCLPLARHLGADQGFYALQPHGLMESLIPRMIEDMAADHLHALRAFQPEGPYDLGGHCNGALIAFEMAQQLRRQGQRVDNLLLIAPPPMTHFQPPYLISYLRFALPSKPTGRMPPHDLTEVPPERFRPALIECYGMALMSYSVQHYAGRICVIQPMEDQLVNPWDVLHHRFGLGSMPSEGMGPLPWQQVAADVEFRTVPGNHITAVTQHVEALARSLLGCLRGSVGEPRTRNP